MWVRLWVWRRREQARDEEMVYDIAVVDAAERIEHMDAGGQDTNEEVTIDRLRRRISIVPMCRHRHISR